MPKRQPKKPYQPYDVLTMDGVAATDEALYFSELDDLELEQELALKEELKDYELMAHKEKLYQ